MRTHVNGYNGNRMHFIHCCSDQAANRKKKQYKKRKKNKKRTRISPNDKVIAMKRKLDTFDFGIKMAKLLNGTCFSKRTK